jgi:hypothetical protein
MSILDILYDLYKEMGSFDIDDAPNIHTDNRLSLGGCTEANLASGTCSLLGCSISGLVGSSLLARGLCEPAVWDWREAASASDALGGLALISRFSINGASLLARGRPGVRSSI